MKTVRRLLAGPGALIYLVPLAMLALKPPSVSAEELVTFKSAPYRLGQLQQRLARERGEAGVETSETIEGYLSKPEGDGPFPAVVFLHGCSGLHKNIRTHFAELMTSWGYVSLAVDSFASRGIKQACNGPTPSRQGDGLGALSYLSKLSFVDPRRVALIGSSQGGIAALEIASGDEQRVFDVPNDLKFKAAVAYYPLCSVAKEALSIPTLIMIGELDDWTPANACDMWMKARNGSGASVKLIIYPGAYHAFDEPALATGRTSFGHWLKYEPNAAESSVQEMHQFLSAKLSY